MDRVCLRERGRVHLTSPARLRRASNSVYPPTKRPLTKIWGNVRCPVRRFSADSCASLTTLRTSRFCVPNNRLANAFAFTHHGHPSIEWITTDVPLGTRVWSFGFVIRPLPPPPPELRACLGIFQAVYEREHAHAQHFLFRSRSSYSIEFKKRSHTSNRPLQSLNLSSWFWYKHSVPVDRPSVIHNRTRCLACSTSALYSAMSRTLLY